MGSDDAFDKPQDFGVGKKKKRPTIQQLDRFIRKRLNAALKAIPKEVPFGMMDPNVHELQQNLQEIETMLYELDVDERRQEDREFDREESVEAKRRHPDIEHLIIDLDRNIQEIVRQLGKERPPTFVALNLSLFVGAVVRILDKFPKESFDASQVQLGPHTRDQRVQKILDTMLQG